MHGRLSLKSVSRRACGGMDEAEQGWYEKVRFRHAKRLLAETLSRIEARNQQEQAKGPSKEEMARLDQERIAALVVGRRQREAKLVADFVSDEIYDLDDEDGLAMQQALNDSRRRVESLCEGRKQADCTELVTDDVIRELQSFLTSCNVYLGFVQPGRDTAEILRPLKDKTTSSNLARDEDGEGQEIAVRKIKFHWKSSVEAQRLTCKSTGRLAPTPDTVFKCVDTGHAVVVGKALDNGTTTEDFKPNGARAITTSRENDYQFRNDGDSVPVVDGRDSGVAVQRPSTPVSENVLGAADDTTRPSPTIVDLEWRQSLSSVERSLEASLVLDAEARPQVCVPLYGAGENGEIIGVIGVQGFSAGVVIEDSDWRNWFAARMAPVDGGDSRGAKRLKLVRPRGLPARGKLENVPSGTAAKVIYGAIESISLKRGMPVYAVRWEDGLVQLDIPRKYVGDVVGEDESSAGKGASLTNEVVEHLSWIGKTVGPVVDQVRKAAYTAALQKVTLAVDARPRDVLESALFALVQCLPSLTAAEVWQADDGDRLRCIIRLTSGGGYCRPNERVDGVLHEQEAEFFCTRMAFTSTPSRQFGGFGHGNLRDSLPLKEKDTSKLRPSGSDSSLKNRILKSKRTPGILAAPFCDLRFKVGKSWIGADRLACGFALVLRTPILLAQGKVETVPSVGETSISSRQNQYIAAAAPSTTSQNDGHEENERFLATVAKEAEVALACVRGREKRAATRALALKRLSVSCKKKTISGREANEAVLAEIAAVLPGCRAYIGILQPGGDSMLYEAATANSGMLGKELRRGDGVSYTCLDSPDISVRVIEYRQPGSPVPPGPPRPPSLATTGEGTRPPVLAVGAEVEVWYASSWLSAAVTRSRGHDFYDVEYTGFKETEAGVPRWRLRETMVLEHLDVKVFSCDGFDERVGAVGDCEGSSSVAWPWPFVCVPLRSEGNRLGVLGVDGWAGVHLGRKEEKHPEAPVVSFLKQTAELLATAHYAERRKRALATLGATVRGKDTTEDGAFEALLVLLRETIIFRERIDILETRAVEPGMVYCRGSCAERDKGGHRGYDRTWLEQDNPVEVYEANAARRVDELCITPLQMRQLGNREGMLFRPESTKGDLSSYQQELHVIARDGPGGSRGLKATAIESKAGEIIGRFQRLTVQPGGSRPAADGWYLVRVARSLPEVPPAQTRGGARWTTKVTKETKGKNAGGKAEDGDIALLSDMCRRLEVGFMAIASREQRACVRGKALDRIRACCGEFMAGTSNESPAPRVKSAAIALRGSNETQKFPGSTKGTSTLPETSSAYVINGDHAGYSMVSTCAPAKSASEPRNGKLAVAGPAPSRGTYTDDVESSATASAAAHSISRGRLLTSIKEHPAKGNQADNVSLTTSAPSGGRSPTVGDASANVGIPNLAGEDQSNVLQKSTCPDASWQNTRATAAAPAAMKDVGILFFKAHIPPPTSAETPDGRKGALVTLKDGRLGVLVQQGERRVAVVELPGGKQQILAENQVVPGQSMFLHSGQVGLLAEKVDGSYAVVVTSTSGKVTVVDETKSGGRTKLPLSALKDVESLAAIAIGDNSRTAPRGGVDVMKQVIAATQWALPQVDVYVGVLAPFSSSLYFVEGSSRSAAAGKRVYRHSKPNGGEVFGVTSNTGNADDNDAQSLDAHEMQSPSWDVIDSCTMTVVAGSASEASRRLHFFSDPLQQGWPWIAIPVRPGLLSRAVRGVLCVDKFEEPWVDEEMVAQHPESDVRTFLEASAASLGLVFDREMKTRALQALRSIHIGHEAGNKITHGSDNAETPADGGDPRCRGKKSVSDVIWRAEDVYAAVTEALTQALVHCERFEIWEVIQPHDEEGRYFLEPSLAGKPPPFEAEDGDTREILRLEVTHCTGLAKADRFGLSDPLCVVIWQGREVGRTPTVYNTVRPVWTECLFDLPIGELPLGFRTSVGAGSVGNVTGMEYENSETHRLAGVVKENRDEMKAEMMLVLQVWDEDDGVPSDFLGELRLGGDALLERAQAAQKLELPLGPKHDGSLTAEKLKLVQGSLGLRISPATDGALRVLQESEDAKKVFLEVMILESRGLDRGVRGRPFALVGLDGKTLGQTPAVPNGSDPVWMEAVHVEILRARLVQEQEASEQHASAFSVTVWDQAALGLGSQVAFIGQFNMSASELAACARGPVEDEGCKNSRRRHEVPLMDLNGDTSVGHLAFTVQEASPDEWRAEAARAARGVPHHDRMPSKPVFDRKVRLTVLRAKGLAQADNTGSSDPMCIIRRRGREVGRTATVYACLDPVWGGIEEEGESFLLTIPHPREAAMGRGGVAIEVYDEDFGEPTDFLGQVSISSDDLLRFRSVGTFKGAYADTREISLEKKPDNEVPLTEQWLVQGVIRYRLEGVDKGEERPTDLIIVDRPHPSIDGSSEFSSTAGTLLLKSSQYRKLEIRVMEAHGLAKADKFGLSDPYVIVRANGERQLGRTRTIPLSLDPVWTDPEERFVISVGIEDVVECNIALEVWDEDDLGQGDFLGQVVLSKADLLGFGLPTGAMECELEPTKDEVEGFNDLVQGVLTFSVREAYGGMPDEPVEREPCRSEVSLTVILAKGLAKADVFGKSDPFALVLLNNRELGRTRTIFKTLDPSWTNPTETFAVKIGGNRARCNVVVQIWDEDLGKRGDFLGQASIGWQDLDLQPDEACRNIDLPLGIRDGVPAREQGLVQGSIQLVVEAPIVEDIVGGGNARSYVVTIDRAWGLANADRFGKSDPFVSVKVNGDGDDTEKGRTRTLASTLHPVWKDPPEVFIVTGVEIMVLEVWDANRLQKRDFLGEVRLTKDDFAVQIPVDGAHEFTAALAPKPGVTERCNNLVQGFLRFNCQDWMSPDRLIGEGLGEMMMLTVISASSLPRRRFGLPSPLACVRWNGLDVGRTRVVRKNSSPVWDESFQVAVPRDSDGNDQTEGGTVRPDIEVIVEILDGHTRGAVGTTNVIGRIDLQDHDLQLPLEGPSCRVIEQPLQLAVPDDDIAGKHTPDHRKKVHAPRLSQQPGATVILLLERIPSSLPPAVPIRTPSSTSALDDPDDTVSHAPNTVDADAVGGQSKATLEERKVELRVHRARGLAKAARDFDVVVRVRACGRDVGTTRVAAVGGTRCPEWIDEGFVLREKACAELCLDVWGCKASGKDAFLGRVLVTLTTEDITNLLRAAELQEQSLHEKPGEILALADQDLVQGNLAFSLRPWRAFNYADEMDKSNACRGLQVQLCLLGVGNLNAPSSNVFATVSYRGTEILKTASVGPKGPVSTAPETPVTATESALYSQYPSAFQHIARGEMVSMSSHRWTHRQNNECLIPLPEGGLERRGIEVEVDLWEAGVKGGDRRDHLGQVTLSGDFVPHLAHGEVVSRPLRPPRSRGRQGNFPARGSLILQLWLRRGGESLASELLGAAVIVEAIAAKNLSDGNGRLTPFCVVKGDGREIGRTEVSTLVGASSDVHTTVARPTNDQVSGSYSWQGPGSQFAVGLSSQSGCLPHISIEVWAAADNYGALPVKKAVKETPQPGASLIGSTEISPDSLVSGPVGPTPLPLVSPATKARTLAGTKTAEKAQGMIMHTPHVVVRFTPQVGSWWGYRAISAASVAKRVKTAAAEEMRDTSAHVLHMTNAEGSARAWRTPVTPGNSVPREAFDDVLELSFASLPACCPQSPTLAVAPISDVGVRLGGTWIGPHAAARHAIIAFRPRQKSLSAGSAKDKVLPPLTPPEDEVFMRGVAAQAEGLLREVRARDLRAEQRRLALLRVHEICAAWSDGRSEASYAVRDAVACHGGNLLAGSEYMEEPATEEEESDGDNDGDSSAMPSARAYGDLLRSFLGALEVALPGVSIYIGLLDGGGQSIRYVACTRGSSMAGKQLLRGEGISFSCVGPRYMSAMIYPPRCVSLPGSDERTVNARQHHSNDRRTVPSTSSGANSGRHPNTFPCTAARLRKGEQKPEDFNFYATQRGPREGQFPDTKAVTSLPEPTQTENKGFRDRSLEEEIVIVQKAFRGKLDRDRVSRLRRGKAETGSKKNKWGWVGMKCAKPTSRPTPKVFDYDGRVGWPFVCVPLVGSLGASSIGVIGMDTFEQMGYGRNGGNEQPDNGVVEAVAEAARVLGKTICTDRRRRALDEVTSSCLNFNATLFDVLHAAAKALATAVVTSSGAEVWTVDPSSGSLFVVTRVDPARTGRPGAGPRVLKDASDRCLKVEVVWADLKRAMLDVETAAAFENVVSISVQISAGEIVIYRTLASRVERLENGSIKAIQWHEGERNLLIDRGVEVLSAQVLAKTQGSSGGARGISTATTSDTIVAAACIRLTAVRNGYNYVSLFSRESDAAEAEEISVHGQDMSRARRVVGQLIVRLGWVEQFAETAPEEGGKHVTLAVRGVSGLAKSSRQQTRDAYCIVTWRGVDLGRTTCCRATRKPDWGRQEFRLYLPDSRNEQVAPLVVEVWADDAEGIGGAFLGQVVVEPSQVQAAAPGIRKLELKKKPASELHSSQQQYVQGKLELSIETPRTAGNTDTAASLLPQSVGWVQRPNHRDAKNWIEVDKERASSSESGRKYQIEKQRKSSDRAPEDPSRDKKENDEPEEGLWQGISWEEEDDEGESLETGTLGTLEVASRADEGTGSEGQDASEPEDLLLCVKGAIGLTEHGKFGHSYPYCVIKVGQREVGRTRAIKFGKHLQWERPEERFRFPMEVITDNPLVTSNLKSVTTNIASIEKNTSRSQHREMPSVSQIPGQPTDEDDDDLDGSRNAALASFTADGTDDHGAISSTTIEVWGKHAVGRHDFLGVVAIPTGDIDHPPGDVWLPLRGGSPPSSPWQADPSRQQSGGGEPAASSQPPNVAETRRPGTASWASGLFKSLRDERSKRPRQGSEAEEHLPLTGSVHIWLGKVRRGNSSGRKPGNGRVLLRIHSAAGLRQADRLGKSDPKCFVVWNGDEAGSTSTRYNTLDPCWDPSKDIFDLRFPRDRSLCQLHIDVWDMDNAGTKRGDFLGRLEIPTISLLYPHVAAGAGGQMTFPLHPLDGPDHGHTKPPTGVGVATKDIYGDGINTGTQETADQTPALDDDSAVNTRTTPTAKHMVGHGVGAAGRFASRMMGNVQKHLAKSETMSGTLTLSLERVEDGDVIGNGDGLAGGKHGGRVRGGVREPPPPTEPEGYAAMKFTVGADVITERKRREGEGISVPRLLSRVEVLHRKLQGAVVTGSSAADLSDMTGGAAAVIPEVLAGQVLSLARRGGGHTILPADCTGHIARDRLVVTLQPALADINDNPIDGTEEWQGGQSREDATKNRRTDRKRILKPREGADDRTRHALVVSCAPGQVSKEDVSAAREIIRAAEAAAVVIHKRRRRRLLMKTCAEAVEKLCRQRRHDYEGLCNEVVTGMQLVCEGAGDEVDSHLRNVASIVSLLAPGGHRLRVAASSGWDPGQAAQADGRITSESITGGMESVGRWSGPLPLASGIVRRVLERGDVFLVVEQSVCVANALWSSIWPETMPHKYSSSDAALEKSVSVIRDGLGLQVSSAFVIAPLWVSGVGCIGLLTLTDLPYAQQRVAHKQFHRKHERRRRTAARGSTCPYVVGEFVDFAKRIGVALGTAVHRTRCHTLVTAVRSERALFVKNDAAVRHPKSTAKPTHVESHTPRTTSVLQWPSDFEAVCSVYSDALMAVSEGVPWIRAVEVWHVSSLPEHYKVFLPEPHQELFETSLSSREHDSSGSCGQDTASAKTTTAASEESPNGGRFDERIIGQTWAGSPVVVLRSLRIPGLQESRRAARWVRESGHGNYHSRENWTDQRLRLLADEWELCTKQALGADSGSHSPMKASLLSASAENETHSGRTSRVEFIERGDGATRSPTTALATPCPFMVHSGHLILPFTNGRVREDRDVVGHGLALAVDRGVDWSPWEMHLTDVAAAATRRFEVLENEACAAEKLRVKSWAAKILGGGRQHSLDHNEEDIHGVGEDVPRKDAAID